MVANHSRKHHEPNDVAEDAPARSDRPFPYVTPQEFLAMSPEEQAERNRRAIALLDSFAEGDVEEQRETFAALVRGLNEGRPKGYEIYPEYVDNDADDAL